VLEETLARGPEPESLDAEVEFREPAQPGTAVVLRENDGMLWIAAEDGRVHASVAFPDDRAG
jgi:hypothetical protein